MSTDSLDVSNDPRTNWLTIADVAQQLEVSVKTVRRRLKLGELTGEMVHDPTIGADRWMFDPDNLPRSSGSAAVIPVELLDRLADAYKDAADANARAEVAERVTEFEKERRTATEAERDALTARIAELEARRWWQSKM